MWNHRLLNLLCWYLYYIVNVSLVTSNKKCDSSFPAVWFKACQSTSVFPLRDDCKIIFGVLLRISEYDGDGRVKAAVWQQSWWCDYWSCEQKTHYKCRMNHGTSQMGCLLFTYSHFCLHQPRPHGIQTYGLNASGWITLWLCLFWDRAMH